MSRHLNTLYINTQGAYLSKEGECVCVRVDHNELVRLPIHALDSIICFGNVTCSPWLMAHCAENNVGMSFLSQHGRFLASVQGRQSGNVLLRREQYRRADSDTGSSAAARSFVLGKLVNCRAVLRRAVRDRPDAPNAHHLSHAADLMTQFGRKVENATSLEDIRGLEGQAANVYWNVFDHLITADNKKMRFAGRNRRPPMDPVNCLLSFLYTLLAHDARSALESVGLDPQVGFLHRDRSGRPSLALDLMEEFRPCFADRLVLSLINREQIKPRSFDFTESGAVLLKEEARKQVIRSWQERKKDTLTHPFTGKKMEVGLLWHVQARLLARFIRGDIDAYPPFVWR